MKTPTFKDYIELFNNTNRLYVLAAIFIISLIVSIFVVPYTIPIAFVSIFCFIDVVGFKHFSECGDVLICSAQHPSDLIKAQRVLPAYRILQVTLQISFLTLILTNFGILYVIASETLHWFGVQDILYYWTVKQKHPYIWGWLHWTPFGIIAGDLKNSVVILQSIIGILISILLIVFFV
jgi:hypothetical protein